MNSLLLIVRAGNPLAVAALALVASCSGNSHTASGPAAGAPANAAAYAQPLARSQVRERALATLTEAAMGRDPQLRANAIEGLHAAPSRVEPVIRVGLQDSNLAVRFVSAMTVGKLTLRQSAPLVPPLLSDPSPMVRAAAIYAVARTGGNADPTPLAAMLRDPDPRIRAQAAFVLGELGNSSATGMLKEAAKDSMPRAPVAQVGLMRLQIAEALVKLGDPTAIETIRAHLYPARPEDFELTALAVQIIGQVRDRRSVDQLVILTAMKDEYRMPAEVRLAAAASLAQLGRPEGAFIADEYHANPIPALRAQAAFVYGEAAGQESLARLDGLLGDADRLVRVAAAAATVKAVDRLSGGARPEGAPRAAVEGTRE